MTEKQKRGIQYLNRISKKLDEVTYQELCIDLSSFFPTVPISIYETTNIKNPREPQPRDQSIIYRARENEKEIPEKASLRLPFKELNKISLIPDHKRHKIKTFGRCNKPEEARFYASSSFKTAAIEAITTGFVENPESRGVTVGCWRIKEPLIIAQINYSQKSLKRFLEHDEELYRKMLDYSKGLDQHHMQQVKEQGEYDPDFAIELISILADEFAKIDIKNHHDYKISNYYCEQILENTILEDGKTKIDGILYPSVSLSYQENNLVLHPRAMEKLKFINAMMVWVAHDSSNGITRFTPLEQNVKTDDDGILQWNKFEW